MRFARSATTHVLQALLEGAIIASLVVVLIAGTAFAAKGGNNGTSGGSKGGGGATATGTCMVVPNPVPVNTSFVISGTGYAANMRVNVTDTNAYGTMVYFATTDSSGSFAVAGTAYAVGSDAVKVWNASVTKQYVIGSCAFSVN